MSDFECSSTRCVNTASDYCKRCSHANFFGSHSINGVTYHWTFSPMFGPLFTDSEYKDYYDQPVPPSPEWEAFGIWYEKRKHKEAMKLKNKETEV